MRPRAVLLGCTALVAASWFSPVFNTAGDQIGMRLRTSGTVYERLAQLGQRDLILCSTVIFLTTVGAGSYPTPGDWNNANNSIECIAAGLKGFTGSGGSTTGSGGPGACYAAKSNVTLSGSVSYQIGDGTGAGSDSNNTWFISTTDVQAVMGTDTTACAGTTVFAGGAGASSGTSRGGGGAAGPFGAGASGSGATGGQGDNGNGGAGGGSNTAGSPGAEYTATAGGTAGSGGGGGGISAAGVGKSGGAYGGGGGGGRGAGNAGGSGGNGLIVVTYTAASGSKAMPVFARPLRVWLKR